MTAARAVALGALGALVLGGLAVACRERPTPSVPPVTSAHPTPSADPVLSGPAGDASLATGAEDAGVVAPASPPLDVAIVALPANVAAPPCGEVAVAVVEGTASALGATLKAGDVLFARDREPFEAKGKGLVVTAAREAPGACTPAKPGAPTIVRVASTPELAWGKGTMRARLQLGEEQGASFYMGRLEGTAPAPPHAHAGTWEILAAIDGAGTFVVDGKESRLWPRQVVAVPPDTKHEWRPDPGSNLRAVQIYSPPGPEKRFVTLAAAERDAGSLPAVPLAPPVKKPVQPD